MTAAELDELRKPLTEIERADLSAVCQYVLKPAGFMLLRRALFSLDDLRQKLEQQTRRVSVAKENAAELPRAEIISELAIEQSNVLFWMQREGEAQAKLEAAQRRASWAELLAGLALGNRLVRNRHRGYLWLYHKNFDGGDELSCSFDGSGLPIETPELRTALEQALKGSA